MNRLRQFPDHRFIGTRDDMVVYDCDDDEQFAALLRRVEEEDAVGSTLVAAFAPDTLDEAHNRGFTGR